MKKARRQPNERPTLQEWAEGTAETDRPDRPELADFKGDADAQDPWACTRCGCKLFKVVHVYVRKDGKRIRRRRCEHCGLIKMTVELPE